MSAVRKIQIIPIVFKKNDPNNDFNVMIKNPEYNANSLFLFNDNVQHHKTNKVGGGNGIIRPYNKYGNLKINNRPLSAGIVTGWFGKTTGFQNLEDPFVKNTIHENINEIYEISNDNHEAIKNSLNEFLQFKFLDISFTNLGTKHDTLVNKLLAQNPVNILNGIQVTELKDDVSNIISEMDVSFIIDILIKRINALKNELGDELNRVSSSYEEMYNTLQAKFGVVGATN